jgi:toxin YoeB
MKIIWAEKAWEDYLYWQENDPKLLKRINRIIMEIKREPFKGIGAPEPLRYHWKGYWSRRIDNEHRLVYKVNEDELSIAQCRYHY